MPRLPGVLETSQEMYMDYVSTESAGNGLLGVIKNLVINHNLHENGVLEKARNTILPKMIDVNLSFGALHEHAMGWDSQGRFGAPAGASEGQGSNTFPYGVTLNDPAAAAAITNPQDISAIELDMKKQDKYMQARTDEASARYRGWTGKHMGDQSRYKADLAGKNGDHYQELAAGLGDPDEPWIHSSEHGRGDL